MVTRTVTESASQNCSSSSRTQDSNGTGTGTSTESATPTCSLSELPQSFYIKDSASQRWHALDLASGTTRGVDLSTTKYATAFQVNSTNDGSITGIVQLVADVVTTGHNASNSTVHTPYSAWIHNTGGPIRFFNSSSLPGWDSGYQIVTASFSTYLCKLILITWMQHDLSYPETCNNGTLWLDGGLVDTGCQRVTLDVSVGGF